MTDIRHITLDAMDTIIFLNTPPSVIYGDVLQRILKRDFPRLREDKSVFSDYWQKAMEKVKILTPEGVDKFSYPHHRCGFWGMLFEEMFRDLDVSLDYLEMYCEIVFPEFLKPLYWDIEPSLADFTAQAQKRNISLSVISNWDDRLPVLLENLGIKKYFQNIVTSAGAGYEKPSSRIFSFFYEEARKVQPDLEKSRILHIGDKEREDFRGALHFGFHSVLYGTEEESHSISRLSDVFRKKMFA